MSGSGEPVVDDPDAPIVLVTDPPASDPPEADPPAPTPTRRRGTPRTFTEEDLEKARQEEKDKLYARLGKVEDLETELQQLREREAAAERERKKQEKAAEEARLAAEREKMTAQELIESYKAEQEATIAEMRNELERERLLREKEREYSELLGYKAARMAEQGENIMPQLRDLVRGNTREEIDQSIEDLIRRTESVMGEVQAQFQGFRAAQPGTAPTGAPATGPLDLGNVRELTLDELKNMSMEEFANSRAALHEAVRRQRRG